MWKITCNHVSTSALMFHCGLLNKAYTMLHHYQQNYQFFFLTFLTSKRNNMILLEVQCSYSPPVQVLRHFPVTEAGLERRWHYPGLEEGRAPLSPSSVQMVLEMAVSGTVTFIEKLHWTLEEPRLPTTSIQQNKESPFLENTDISYWITRKLWKSMDLGPKEA